MRVSIIVPDRTVVCDGEGAAIPEASFPPTEAGVRAIQWYGEFGDVEYVTGSPVHFTDIAVVHKYVDAFNAARLIA